ncbi:glycoside hydrolase family 76 protein [uncultured Mucilaginibacter sp.]|uniref:glycoside hydrolase family 76 protein n=1 Tax=uncultured Mucilaginibacter sp. TaxID=797541 RepID=UPI0026398518|nr:glycoside hydrolase family 76 protein [uncultured Mucilaginibacter sp.]
MKINNFSCRLARYMLLTIAILSSCSKGSNSPAPINPGTGTGGTTTPIANAYAAVADSMQNKTYSTYLSANGNYYVQNNTGNTNFNYWPQAHMLDVLTDAYLRTKNTVYPQRMKALLTGLKATNGGVYPNDYYDDMGWMANACLRAYAATNDADYLNTAQILYTDIKTGSNTSQGGGIAWRKTQLNYKNSPSTTNGIILAARMYELQNNVNDLTLAKSLYSWMKVTLVDPATGVVYDGINSNGTNTLDKNIYTYNQGAFIGAAIELYNATKDPTYLADAVLTANNAITDSRIVSGGVLKSEGQGDGGLFKGIEVRYLTVLTELSGLDAANSTKYAAFLQNNVLYLYKVGIAKPAYLAGPDWTQKPTGSVDLTTQLSGMMMMEAAAKLQAEGKIQ